MLAAALAATAFAPSPAPALPGTALDSIRITDVAASADPPRAGAAFAFSARIEFASTPGSTHCSVRLNGRRLRAVRLTWESSVARCTLVVPRRARGKRLTVALVALLGGNRARQARSFTVS